MAQTYISKGFTMTLFEENVATIVTELGKIKIVPVLAIEAVDDGLKMCGLLNDLGLKTAEITFRTEAAEEIISLASKKYPDLVIGAGTILNVDDLHRAFQAGAQFAVAPGFNPTVVKAAIENGYAFFPGVATPSEVEQAMELGCRMFKFFPAEAAGGIPMIKSLVGPYKHMGVKFMPTGGLNPQNIGNYLALNELPCAGGTWLGPSSDIEAGNWSKIEQNIKDAVALAATL
jgi:2-dehydro-3-deoxyphosphogluconate aldolase / (4S)-4-hydroxy-2-oxoglutarate aldolase